MKADSFNRGFLPRFFFGPFHNLMIRNTYG